MPLSLLYNLNIYTYTHRHIHTYIHMQLWGSNYHNQDSEHIYPAPKISLCLCNFSLSSFPAHSLPQTITDLLHVTIGQFVFFRLLCKWNHTVYVLCLLLLSIIIPRVTLLIAHINISFLFRVEQYFIVWVYRNLFKHSSLDDIWVSK